MDTASVAGKFMYSYPSQCIFVASCEDNQAEAYTNGHERLGLCR